MFFCVPKPHWVWALTCDGNSQLHCCGSAVSSTVVSWPQFWHWVFGVQWTTSEIFCCKFSANSDNCSRLARYTLLSVMLGISNNNKNSLFLSLSLSPSPLSLVLWVWMCVCVYLCVRVCVWGGASVCLSFHFSLSLAACRCLSFSVQLSLSVSVSVSLSPSLSLFIVRWPGDWRWGVNSPCTN